MGDTLSAAQEGSSPLTRFELLYTLRHPTKPDIYTCEKVIIDRQDHLSGYRNALEIMMEIQVLYWQHSERNQGGLGSKARLSACSPVLERHLLVVTMMLIGLFFTISHRQIPAVFWASAHVPGRQSM